MHASIWCRFNTLVRPLITASRGATRGEEEPLPSTDTKFVSSRDMLDGTTSSSSLHSDKIDTPCSASVTKRSSFSHLSGMRAKIDAIIFAFCYSS